MTRRLGSAKARLGGWGLGCMVPVLGFLVLGIVVVSLIRFLFAPWAFFLGGRFHPISAWAGEARFHTRAGGFILVLDLEPTPSSRLGYPSVIGNAVLFTPRGERIPMRVAGSLLERAIGFAPEGVPMSLELHHRTMWSGVANTDPRPRVLLRGIWHGSDLETTDGGSLAAAFLPDGRVDRGAGRPRPVAPETVRVVLHTCAWREYLRVILGGAPTPAPDAGT